MKIGDSLFRDVFEGGVPGGILGEIKQMNDKFMKIKSKKSITLSLKKLNE